MITDALVLLDTYILELALLALVLVPALALHARRRERNAERRAESAATPPPAIIPQKPAEQPAELPAEPPASTTARIAIPEPLVATAPTVAVERTATAPVEPVTTPVAAADAAPEMPTASGPGDEGPDASPKADAQAPVARIAPPEPKAPAGPERASFIEESPATESGATGDLGVDAGEPDAARVGEAASAPVAVAIVDPVVEPIPAVAEPAAEPVTAFARTPRPDTPLPPAQAEPAPPVVTEAAEPASPPVEVEPPPSGPTPARLLVVDDSAVVRAKLRKLLEGAGHPVDLARDGREALAMLAGARYSLMITDLEMPTMSGFELIAAVRGMASLGGIPIVAITGHDDLDAYRSRLPGLSGLFRKPWPDAELLTRIAALLAESAPAAPPAGSSTPADARPVAAA